MTPTQEHILKFIRISSQNHNEIRIEWDSLVVYLMRDENRNFSAAKLERAFNEEIEEKLIGKPLNEKTFAAIAIYIDLMSLYLQQDSEANKFDEQQQIERMAARIRDGESQKGPFG